MRSTTGLLAYLILHKQCSHAREKVAALLWGGVSNVQARHSLRTVLATLRKEVHRELLIADRQTVQINPDISTWVDALRMDASLIPQAIAKALGVYEVPDVPISETLVGRLRPRGMLLVLDNCEHLPGRVAQLVVTRLSACVELKILTTSREALGALGEMILRVLSLSFPMSGESLPGEKSDTSRRRGSLRDAIASGEVLDLTASLVDKSLVQAVEGPHGDARYRMLEMVRQYGLEQFGTGGHLEAARPTGLRPGAPSV